MSIINRYINTTKVPSPSGSVTPYEVYYQFSPGGCEDTPPSSPCIPGSWIGTNEYGFTLVGSQPISVPTQTYSSSVNYTTSIPCYIYGEKSVAGVRCWHGAFGWNSENYNCGNYTESITSPDQVKYLQMEVNANYTDIIYSGSQPIYSNSEVATGSITVNSNSGEITSTAQTTKTEQKWFYSGMYMYTSYYSDGGQGYTLSAPGDTTFYYNSGMTTDIDNLFNGATCGSMPSPIQFTEGAATLYDSVNGWNTYCSENGYTSSYLPDITDPFNYSGGATVTASISADEYITFNISWSTSATTFTWNVNLTTPVFDEPTPPPYEYITFAGTVTLNSPNPASSVQSDIFGLMNQWNLADDNQYPWRTDQLPQVAPLMARNEVTFNVAPIGFNTYTVDDYSTGQITSGSYSGSWNQRAWFDPYCYSWSGSYGAASLIKMIDGSILGAPQPTGYENYFMWDFIDWRGCEYSSDDSSGFTWYQWGNGMWLEDYNSQIGAQLPLCATRWTDNFQACSRQTGAGIYYADPTIPNFNLYNGTGDPRLWVYKYAITCPKWQSMNFYRPAGVDRFVYDETQVYCVTNMSGSGAGSTWTVTDYIGDTPPSGSISGAVWGGQSVDGFYNVSSYSGGTLTLGSLIYPLPTSWQDGSNDEDTAFGKLRWVTGSINAPGILGRAEVTPTNLGSGSIQLYGPSVFQWCVSGDPVNLYNNAMTSVVGTNLPITKIDDNTATLSGSYDPTIAYVTPYKMWDGTTNGGNYYFNDVSSKGDYAVLTWGLDFRNPTSDNGYLSYTQQEVAIPISGCNPPAICITPNSESFINGVTINMDAIPLDERYGTKWIGWPQLMMTDPYWQRPHNPCGSYGISWQADNGTCEESSDSALIFPLPPQVETLLNIPCTFGFTHTVCPPLSSTPLPGVTIGWLSPILYTGSDVAFPPNLSGFGAIGYPSQTYPDTSLKANLIDAVSPDSGCVYLSEYSQWVIGC